LGNPVECDGDAVDRPSGDHFHRAVLAVRNIWGCPEAFQRIAQLAPAGADIVRLITHAHQIVQRLFQRLDGQAWSVIPDGHAIRLNRDLDVRCNAGGLAGIKGVVDQLLHQSHRPLRPPKADLHLELFLAEEFQQAAGLERRAL
jgi:hypothetical protein